jgi:chromosome segregation ATPase
MIDQTQPPPQSQPARVTLEDVRHAIQGVDPNTTNGSKIRALLGGRGSLETIQKHLTSLRQELATATATTVAGDQVPAIPQEAAQAMWQAAYSAAQVLGLRRAEALAAERDAALLKLETTAGDVAALVATVDGQAEQLAAATAIEAAHLAELNRVKAEQAAQAQELERTRQEMANVQAAAIHAAELAEAGRELLRQELARLTDQVGELKAALYRRADALAPAQA